MNYGDTIAHLLDFFQVLLWKENELKVEVTGVKNRLYKISGPESHARKCYIRNNSFIYFIIRDTDISMKDGYCISRPF